MLKAIEKVLFDENVGIDFQVRPLEYMSENCYDFYEGYTDYGDIEKYVDKYEKYHNGVVNGTIGTTEFKTDYKDPIQDTLKEYLEDIYKDKHLYSQLCEYEIEEILNSTSSRMFYEIEHQAEEMAKEREILKAIRDERNKELAESGDIDDLINSFESDITNTGDHEHNGHDEI